MTSLPNTGRQTAPGPLTPGMFSEVPDRRTYSNSPANHFLIVCKIAYGGLGSPQTRALPNALPSAPPVSLYPQCHIPNFWSHPSFPYFLPIMTAVGYFGGGFLSPRNNGFITLRCHSQNGSRRQVAESHGN